MSRLKDKFSSYKAGDGTCPDKNEVPLEPEARLRGYGACELAGPDMTCNKP